MRPREDGSREDQITPEASPWHDRSRNHWSRFWNTVGQSMVHPGRLGRGLPSQMTMGSSLLFVSCIYGLILLVGLVPVWGFSWFMNNPGGTPPAWSQLTSFLQAVLLIPGVLVGLVVYGTMTHGLLRLTGKTTGGIGRTIGSMGFGFGPMIFGMLPCIGPYCLQWMAAIWMMVSMILVLVHAQGVSGLRASMAVLVPVFSVTVVWVAIVVHAITSTVAAVQGFAANPALQGPPGLTLGVPPEGTQVMVGDSMVMFDEAVVLELVDQALELPTFEQMVRNPRVVVMSSSEQVPEASPVLIEGTGFQGWWIPGLMVVKGRSGAFIVSCQELGPGTPGADLARSTPAGRSYRIVDSNGVVRNLSEEGGTVGRISDVLRTAILDLGDRGADLNADIIEQWVDASCRSFGSE